MKVGPQNERGGGFVCLVKYRIHNTNDVHDLRVMIARALDVTEDPIKEGAQSLKQFTLFSSILVSLLMY